MPKYSSHLQKKVFAIIALFFVARLVLQRYLDYGTTADLGLCDLAQLVCPVLAGICGLYFVRKQIQDGVKGLRPTAWFLISLFPLVWAGGKLLNVYYELCLSAHAPIPGIPDAFFLASVSLLCIGVFVLCHNSISVRRAKLILDSFVGLLGLAVAGWHLAVQRLWFYSSAAESTKLIGITYPIADIGALIIVCIMLSNPSGSAAIRRTLTLLAAGILTIALGDSMQVYDILRGHDTIGVSASWAFDIAWLFFAYVFAKPVWFKEESENRQAEKLQHSSATAVPSNPPRSVLLVFSPYFLAFLVCICIMTNDYLDFGRLRASTFIASYAVMLLVIVQQVFTLIENHRLTFDLESRLSENKRLTSQLRQFSEGLEQIVDRRAQQLGALHQLTRAVHNTQQVDAVLASASKHTSAVMHGIAVAVWMTERRMDLDHDTFGLAHLEMSDDTPCMVDRFIHGFEASVWDGCAVVPIADRTTQDSEQHGSIAELLYAPMRFRNDLLGMIGVIRTVEQSEYRDGAFDQSDRDLIESIGLEVATALQHARQFTAARVAADRDPVTDLYNHRAIHQHLDSELAEAKSSDSPLSIIMMDLNDFKLFNDTYGHPVGDQVLRLVARVLREENSTAICGRYGGDEFLILLPNQSIHSAREFADRLRHRLISEGFRSPDVEDGIPIPIALSFGVSVFPDDSSDRHELLTLADANLYQAKRSESGIGVTNTIQRVNRRLRNESSFSILDAMVTSIDNKDSYTRRHSDDVTKYALCLAQELGLSEETMRIIRIGSLLHDVGKIGIPEAILRKPGRLTLAEFDAMKQHPSLGAMIVSSIPGMEGVIDAIRCHHERWDGNGYPDHLAGTDIPMIGRIVALADAFSAMTTDRPYRAGMNSERALDQIEKNMGTQFDPVMAHAFCSAMRWQIAIASPGSKIKAIDTDNDLQIAA